jgi:TIR domain
VWYDQWTPKLGDSLPQAINEGLSSCRYAVVILSPNFTRKQWTKLEFDSLVARETQEGAKRILPVWHKITADEVAAFSLTLSSRLAVSTATGMEAVIAAIVNVLSDPAAGGAEPAVAPRVDSDPADDPARRIAEAVQRAREYLLPQPLSVSEAVAESVRRSFSEAGVVPSLMHVSPYLASGEAAFRVVGYLAAQVAAAQGADIRSWALELTAAFGREQREAVEHQETRPLWQLLVAVGYLLKQSPSHPDRDYLRDAMRDTQTFLQQHGHIDPDGECKRGLAYLLEGNW